MALRTPYYLIDEKKLLRNLKIIEHIREKSGAKVILALKCFSTWSVFPLIRKYLDGTTGSSIYEARLGYEKFGKEVQVYSVAFSPEEIKEVKKYASKVIFNSISQLVSFYAEVKEKKIGLRLNPQISYSNFDLADPARKYSRLGVINKKDVQKVLHLISGVMFHFNCENADFNNLKSSLNFISKKYSDLFRKLEWVSFGGGIYFTRPEYPRKEFIQLLKNFSEKFSVQVYLEPGESVITETAELVTKVLDIVHNRIDIAIVDASTEAHMLDLLIYRTPAKIKISGSKKFPYIIAGRSCLAGDVFGTYKFPEKLKIGQIIKIDDAAGYTMVKKNWFNGLPMPAIVVKRLNGKLDIVRQFTYDDYCRSLS